MTKRSIRRALELVRAKRFADYMRQPAPEDCKPGACIPIPDGVLLEDVIWWHNREIRP